MKNSPVLSQIFLTLIPCYNKKEVLTSKNLMKECQHSNQNNKRKNMSSSLPTLSPARDCVCHRAFPCRKELDNVKSLMNVVFILNLLLLLLHPGITCTSIVHFWILTDLTVSSAVSSECRTIRSRHLWLWRLKRIRYSEGGEKVLSMLLGNQQRHSRSKYSVLESSKVDFEY
jgi:hypothetical protein